MDLLIDQSQQEAPFEQNGCNEGLLGLVLLFTDMGLEIHAADGKSMHAPEMAVPIRNVLSLSLLGSSLCLDSTGEVWERVVTILPYCRLWFGFITLHKRLS